VGGGRVFEQQPGDGAAPRVDSDLPIGRRPTTTTTTATTTSSTIIS